MLNRFQIFYADLGKSSLEAYHHRSALQSRDSHGMQRFKAIFLLLFDLIDIFKQVLTRRCLSFNQ